VNTEAVIRTMLRRSRRSRTGLRVIALTLLFSWFDGAIAARAEEATSAASCICRAALVFVLDVTGSAPAPWLERAKREIRDILAVLPPRTCVTVLGVTEDGIGRPEVILDQECALAPRFKWQKASTSAKMLLAKWDDKSQSLKGERPATDALGTLWQAGKRLRRHDVAAKFLVSVGDLRQNVRIDLDKVSEFDTNKTLDRVRQDRLLPELRGVRVWFVGVDAQGKKDGRFFRSQELFFKDYVRAAGGEPVEFSPHFGWAGAIANAVKRALTPGS
jgi:hypothetical protein